MPDFAFALIRVIMSLKKGSILCQKNSSESENVPLVVSNLLPDTVVLNIVLSHVALLPKEQNIIDGNKTHQYNAQYVERNFTPLPRELNIVRANVGMRPSKRKNEDSHILDRVTFVARNSSSINPIVLSPHDSVLENVPRDGKKHNHIQMEDKEFKYLAHFAENQLTAGNTKLESIVLHFVIDNISNFTILNTHVTIQSSQTEFGNATIIVAYFATLGEVFWFTTLTVIIPMLFSLT